MLNYLQISNIFRTFAADVLVKSHNLIYQEL